MQKKGKYIERFLFFFRETNFLLLPNILLSSVKTPLYNKQNSLQVLGERQMYKEKDIFVLSAPEKGSKQVLTPKKGGGNQISGNRKDEWNFDTQQAHSTEYFM